MAEARKLFEAIEYVRQPTRGSFKTIPASEETTNTQRFEADSLAEGPGFEPRLTESESFERTRLGSCGRESQQDDQQRFHSISPRDLIKALRAIAEQDDD